MKVCAFTAGKRSLGQGSIFRSVCHSVHREEGVAWAPCVKSRKYFEMRQLSENTFQSLTWKSMREFFLVEILVF